MKAVDMFTQSGSVIASVMFIWAMFKQYCPYQLQNYFEKHSKRVFTFVYPFIQITFNEFAGDRFMRSEAYSAIENYLGSSSSMQAKRLKADVVKNSTQSLVLSMDDFEEVTDEFQGVKLRWASGKHIAKTPSFSFYPATDERMYYTLTFHKRHRNLILGTYLSHVLKEGDAIKVKNRQRKLYTNSGSCWRHVVFEHPASFETIAMEAGKKKEIMDDLITFSQAEEFYARIGRAWKRGYLLYGPPGTGKSTMIAAMANLLNYDIYDLELTSVKDNTELRKLLIETSSRSIIVIEDIDCSLDLTGQRKKKKEEQGRGDEKDPKLKLPKEETDSKQSQVTLSGLLNFIDGLWSACKGERLVVFTTNFLEKLDPALIRKGRMDKHIELSYCSFEAFKVLAKNYLRLETHHLYSKIQELLGETKMTPAEVAEHLMPKTLPGDNKVCLEGLIAGLEKAKEDARLKAEEEAREKGSSPEEKATEKDSSPEENAKEQGKENGFCDNGNTETNCKEKE
jgi:chaperone BCS1